MSETSDLAAGPLEAASPRHITPQQLASRLASGEEAAVLDVGERGQYGLGHLLHASNAPFSDLECVVSDLVPVPGTAVVLTGGAPGVATAAADRLADMGYTDVSVLAGGNSEWERSGFELYKGEDVLSKAFGEVIEANCATPHISPAQLKAWLDDSHPVRVLDVRSPPEHANVCVPGAIGVPNGELIHRFGDVVPDPTMPVVTCCAGRTRSIIGAQTLIDAGVPNPVFALSGGTMGWRMAGYTLERGSPRSQTGDVRQPYELVPALQIPFADIPETVRLVREGTRTVYLLDVRSEDEFAAGHLPGSRSAPGGQLVQRTGRWCAVRGALLLLIDDGLCARAAVAGHWLRQMGWDVQRLRLSDAIASWPAATDRHGPRRAPIPAVQRISADQLEEQLATGSAMVIDASAGLTYRARHIPGAFWAIRPEIPALLDLPSDKLVVVHAETDERANLVASDVVRHFPGKTVAILEGGVAAWEANGRSTEATPDQPSDERCIDFLFWVHDRQTGNDRAAQEYFDWEHSLPAQIMRDATAGLQIGGIG